ncbi:hypothetical protein BDU57DRAFT_521527 [Ampelomyces quisqualis]|uniref:Uncharacterized protein n=1 Tax=Ampelomyces quisqualis TaxID=50730 RepID=A0A6A5QC11_AMPQU|nr:hypothetical protein BDU57DRAFT_521527 [Ampelomyces quisqualis]
MAIERLRQPWRICPPTRISYPLMYSVLLAFCAFLLPLASIIQLRTVASTLHLSVLYTIPYMNGPSLVLHAELTLRQRCLMLTVSDCGARRRCVRYVARSNVL